MSVLEDFSTVQTHFSPDPPAHGLLLKSFSFTHDLYVLGCPFFIMAAYCGGSPVHVIISVICQRPVFTFSGCVSPAAVASEAAKQITATAIAFLIFALLKGRSEEHTSELQSR